jgi:hypothetical protein
MAAAHKEVCKASEKAGEQPGDFLARHVSGDWGDVPTEDIKENEFSLKRGFRLWSAYRTSAGDKLWVITEADRSSPCIMLPEREGPVKWQRRTPR